MFTHYHTNRHYYWFGLTAVTLEGKVLWQIGLPDPRNGLLTSDTPFQIHDLDGDGCGEVVTVKDFQLQVLDGRTGRLRRRVFMPEAKSDAGQKPYTLTNGDSIAFVNLSGGKTARGTQSAELSFAGRSRRLPHRPPHPGGKAAMNQPFSGAG